MTLGYCESSIRLAFLGWTLPLFIFTVTDHCTLLHFLSFPIKGNCSCRLSLWGEGHYEILKFDSTVGMFILEW